MESTGRLPEDPALPALEAIRIKGLARAIPGLELDNDPVELRLCNYVAGSRATFEARVGDRRFAVKAYAEDPAPEAQLYRRLSRMGLGGDFGARVPKLITTSRELKVLVMSWLEGRPLSHLIRRGLGERAGQLAASWLWHASRRRIRIGPPCGPGRMLYQAGVSAGVLGASDRLLGADAKAATKKLVRMQPGEKPRQLVHGTLYARHILDLGDGPGVIDWQQFGQGPVEVDAGMFLATISRLAFRHPDVADEAARAEETFMARTRGLVDAGIVDWYRAAGLLHLAGSGLKTGLRRSVPTPEAHALVAEASRRAELLIGSHPILLAEAPTTFARIRSIFTARPRAPSLLHPEVPMEKVGPDLKNPGGTDGTRLR